ncbi:MULTISPECIES: hypothetical protein [Nocardia]|uniref:hypothetical protein n=1 Tax=Nocardia TaxID=1817 RepID=UPI001300221D|nr:MULTISPECIES: hypothetical protein [Nocardia]
MSVRVAEVRFPELVLAIHDARDSHRKWLYRNIIDISAVRIDDADPQVLHRAHDLANPPVTAVTVTRGDTAVDITFHLDDGDALALFHPSAMLGFAADPDEVTAWIGHLATVTAETLAATGIPAVLDIPR